jgi:hypothetical protein
MDNVCHGFDAGDARELLTGCIHELILIHRAWNSWCNQNAKFRTRWEMLCFLWLTLLLARNRMLYNHELYSSFHRTSKENQAHASS